MKKRKLEYGFFFSWTFLMILIGFALGNSFGNNIRKNSIIQIGIGIIGIVSIWKIIKIVDSRRRSLK